MSKLKYLFIKNSLAKYIEKNKKPKMIGKFVPVNEKEEKFDVLEMKKESFSQTLLNFIDEKNISDVDCYKRANIDRKLFSKIRSDDEYQPKKTTVFALIIGLRLNLEDAETLLDCAGYSLSHSLKQDIIIEFAIKKQIYDMSILNEILFSLGCQTLGSKE